ncbi:hypothetical protein MCOR31_010748 [Pyricularia oryzae]|nr:hypothetical protein MCOR26_004862 [Pyricularia oryzae]KAI6349747.1 hypothetical protein MCOR28_000808 [Pyricularia oryzae]KAI6356503.1 hypothetical protein MCOR31_010748 [Pyricularia oryzae]KAI6387377.1 hypothetical protein MCOR32_000525 [Pyricularia oryzae]KAI6423282.1 hypothetical protein MCOR24_003768 [Pyricularia oryzae]
MQMKHAFSSLLLAWLATAPVAAARSDRRLAARTLGNATPSLVVDFIPVVDSNPLKKRVTSTSGGATRPQSNTAARPPANAAARPPANAALSPANNAALRPPTNAVVKPPTNAALKPPTNAALKPPTNAALRPAGNAALKPPANAAPLPLGTSQRPPSGGGIRPAANAAPVSPAKTPVVPRPKSNPVCPTRRNTLGKRATTPVEAGTLAQGQAADELRTWSLKNCIGLAAADCTTGNKIMAHINGINEQQQDYKAQTIAFASHAALVDDKVTMRKPVAADFKNDLTATACAKVAGMVIDIKLLLQQYGFTVIEVERTLKDGDMQITAAGAINVDTGIRSVN